MIGNEKLRQMYAAMLECRMLKERARLPGAQARRPKDYAVAAGHEAVVVGCTIDLGKKDIAVSCPGGAIETFLREIRVRCEKAGNVAVVFSPPGSPASGACRGGAPDDLRDDMWYEALRAAGAESLPILFVRRDQLVEGAGNAKSPAPEHFSYRDSPERDCIRSFLSRKAAPSCSRNGRTYRKNALENGIPRIPVDGNDVVAVYRVAHESIQRARRGGGATLIECLPYRIDTAKRKRGSGPPPRRTGRKMETGPIVDPISSDPIASMERYLSQKNLFRAAWKKQLIHSYLRFY